MIRPEDVPSWLSTRRCRSLRSGSDARPGLHASQGMETEGIVPVFPGETRRSVIYQRSDAISVPIKAGLGPPNPVDGDIQSDPREAVDAAVRIAVSSPPR